MRSVASIHEQGFAIAFSARSVSLCAAPVAASATQSLMPSPPVIENTIFFESSDHMTCEIFAPGGV